MNHSNIPADSIQLVTAQTGCDTQTAAAYLAAEEGNIADSIISLRGDQAAGYSALLDAVKCIAGSSYSVQAADLIDSARAAYRAATERQDTPQTPQGANDGPLYFYRPLTFYNGRVLKCAGICTEGNAALLLTKCATANDGYLIGGAITDGYKGDRIMAADHSEFTGQAQEPPAFFVRAYRKTILRVLDAGAPLSRDELSGECRDIGMDSDFSLAAFCTALAGLLTDGRVFMAGDRYATNTNEIS